MFTRYTSLSLVRTGLGLSSAPAPSASSLVRRSVSSPVPYLSMVMSSQHLSGQVLHACSCTQNLVHDLLPSCIVLKGAEQGMYPAPVRRTSPPRSLWGSAASPNGLRYRRLGRTRLETGNRQSSEQSSKNAPSSQPSGAPRKSGAHFSRQKPSSEWGKYTPGRQIYKPYKAVEVCRRGIPEVHRGCRSH